MTVENIFFQKEGFTQFIDSILDEKSGLIKDYIEKFGVYISKVQKKEEKQLDPELTIKRILDFLKKIYQIYEDEDWERITEDRSNEMINLLNKCMERTSFFTRDKKKTANPLKRKIILSRLMLKNWHLFQNLEINFDDNFNIDQNISSKLSKNLTVFIGKNSEGKSAIFEGLKMGFLGPKKFFIPSIKTQQNKKILEYINKKTLLNARKEGIEHETMKIALWFKVSRPKLDLWDEYCIERIWSIKISPEEKQNNSIYNYEEKIHRLDVLGEGNHQLMDIEAFNHIFNKFIPNQLQSLFIINKSILTKSLIDEKQQFIKNTIYEASEFYIFSILENIIQKVENFQKKEEERWYIENVKQNSNKIKELSKSIKRIQNEINRQTQNLVKNKTEKREIKKIIENKREQIKDYDKEKANQFVELQKELIEINEKIQDRSAKLNKKISKHYVDRQLNPLINWHDLKGKLLNDKEKLPEIPENTNFERFDDYFEILKTILKNNECICERQTTDDIEEKFKQQINKNQLLLQYSLVSKLIEEIDNYPLEISDLIDELESNSKDISDYEKDKIKIQKQMKKVKPTKFIKNIEKIINEIDKLSKKMESVDQNIIKIQFDTDSKNKTKEDYENEIESLKIKQDNPELHKQQELYEKTKIYINACRFIIKELQNNYENTLRKTVEDLITHYFKDIDWEGKFWDGFNIDGEWNINFIDEQKQSISLPSDGQKKIIMISFICALIDIYKFKIPWILDNVLSELSDLNIEGFANQIKSNISFPQQIFFFSVTEWGDIKEFLEESVLQAFKFEKISATESKIIEISNIKRI